MSTRSRITLAVTTIVSAVTVVWVHKVQDEERRALHQGPIKDQQRMEEKALKKKLLANKLEHEHQQELRKQYEAMQPLSGVTVTADEPPKQ